MAASVTSAIIDRFESGEWLNAKELAQQYGVTDGLFHMVMKTLRDKYQYEFESQPIEGTKGPRIAWRMTAQGDRPVTRASVVQPAQKSTSRSTVRERGIALYEAMQPYYDDRGYVTRKMSVYDMVRNDEKAFQLMSHLGQIKRHAVTEALSWLRNVGCVTLGNGSDRRLVRHPADITETPERAEAHLPAPVAQNGTQNGKVLDPIDSVPTEQLANALAQAMWARYEWAISELGRLQSICETKDVEIRRLRHALTALGSPDVSDVARVMLTDA